MIFYMIFLPILVGIFLLFVNPKTAKIIAFLTSSVLLCCGAYIFLNFTPNVAMFESVIPLVPKYGINFAVGIDEINLYILIIIVAAFIQLYFFFDQDKKGYYSNLLFLEAGFIAVSVAKDLLFFYAGWEMMLMPLFIFIGVFGKHKFRNKYALEMMYWAIFGSMIMLCAMICVGVIYYEQNGAFSFIINDLVKADYSRYETILFFAFMLAFAIKIPLFPFHLWMPQAYTRSPVPATFLLSVVASKIAVIGILRFVLPLFPQAFTSFSPLFIWLGIFSMLYFGISAVFHNDFKTILAYASASHLGLIVAGLFALDVEALVGSMYQVMAHAIASSMMFLLVGLISNQLITRDVRELGGLAIKAPKFATFFAIAMISSIGMPATVGFIGEFLILFGLSKTSLVLGFFATSSIVISATYMFIVFRRGVLGKTNDLTERFKDLNKSQIWLFLVQVVAIFLLGIYPQLFISKIQDGLNTHYERYIAPYQRGEK